MRNCLEKIFVGCALRPTGGRDARPIRLCLIDG